MGLLHRRTLKDSVIKVLPNGNKIPYTNVRPKFRSKMTLRCERINDPLLSLTFHVLFENRSEIQYTNESILIFWSLFKEFIFSQNITL